MAKRKALFTIDLGKNGGRKVFYTIDKIKEWVAIEEQYWTWVTQYNTIYNVGAYYKKHYGALNDIKKVVNSANKETQNFETQISDIESKIAQYYKSGSIIHSLSPKAKYLEELQNINERGAALTFSYFYGNRSNHIDFILAAFDAVLFERGIKSTKLNTDKKLSEDFLSDIRENLSKSESILDDKEIGINETSQELKSVLEQSKSDVSNQLTKQDEEFETLLKTAEKSLSNIESVYDRKLAIQSSVRYWKAKAASHKSFLTGFYKIFSGAIVLSVIIVFLEIWLLFKDYTIETPPPYWVATIVILTISVLIWFIRILAKIMLSNIHLQTDANERRVMILTYLSLLRRENAITEDDRKIILQTLFRPSATGIIKDENLPSFIWDKFTSN